MVEASTAALQSNIEYGPEDHFPLENIPFGTFWNVAAQEVHVCTRIGKSVIDLAVLHWHGVFNGPHLSKLDKKLFNSPTLNEFIAAGSEVWHEARVSIQELFKKGNMTLHSEYAFKDNYMFDADTIQMRLPLAIGDYTDFYSSKNHAYNVGVMFRGADNALQPNWLHLPVGYHGRASSIVVNNGHPCDPTNQGISDYIQNLQKNKFEQQRTDVSCSVVQVASDSRGMLRSTGPGEELRPRSYRTPLALVADYPGIINGYPDYGMLIFVSGTDVIRPKGQTSADQKTPIWTACKRLDFEIEVGAIVGKPNKHGQPIKLKDAPQHIFGFTLLNDWSARDLQAWEYIPLGPFNAKNFATTISPWIITAEALEPFKVKLPKQDPEPLPYLRDPDNYSYDVCLDAALKTPTLEQPVVISQSNFKYMYWSANQQLTHHTVTGCPMNVGDVLGSGTISGPEKGSYGSMLEISWGGKEPLKLPNGEERTFLNDGDVLELRGYCKGNGYTIGFGECSGKVMPALEDSEYY